MERQSTSERSSSDEMTWLTGSWTVEPGSSSSSVGSLSRRAGRRRGERHVAVERRVLVARRGLHRGDDLARDAELGEVAERGLAVGPVVPDRLVEPDEPLLDQVVRIAPDEEVRRGLQTHERVVAPHQVLVRVRAALLRQCKQISVINLNRRLRLCRDLGHETSSLGRLAREIGRGAHLPRRLLMNSRAIANPQAQPDARQCCRVMWTRQVASARSGTAGRPRWRSR